MYSTALTPTEVLANFDAKLPNSVPAAASAPVIFQGQEDIFTDVTLSDFIYDMDELYGWNTGLVYELTSAYTPASGGLLGGEFQIAGGSIGTSFPQDIISDDLAFRNGILSAFGDEGGSFTLRGRDDDGSSGTATARVQVLPENDAPRMLERAQGNTAQASATLLDFAVQDPDCDRKIPDLILDIPGDGPLVNTSCTDLGQIVSIEVKAPTTDLGILYLPSASFVCDTYSGAGEITTDTVFDSSDTLVWQVSVDGKTTSVRLCFEACLTGGTGFNDCPVGQNDAGVLGEAFFEHVATDNGGAPATGNITTLVTNVLEIEENAFYRAWEGNTVIVTLQGVDNFCVTFPGDAACPRPKQFVMTLPDPRVGAIFKDITATNPISEGEVLTPGNGNNMDIYFKAAPLYFNMDNWPLCGPNPSAGNLEFSVCPTDDDPTSQFPCDGPFCVASPSTFNTTDPTSAFTTEDLEGELMGVDCDDPENLATGVNVGTGFDWVGCPARIVYQMRVGGFDSAPGAGAQVWITNTNQAPRFVLPGPVFEGVRKAEATPFFFNESFVQIEDPDGNNRVMELYVHASRSSGVEMSFPQLSEENKNLSFTRNKDQFQTGNEIILGMRGTLRALNEALRLFVIQQPTAVAREDILFILADVARDNVNDEPLAGNVDTFSPPAAIAARDSFFRVTATVQVNFVVETPTEDFTVQAVVLWSSIVGGSLLCLGCLYGVLHAIFRRALMGERAALWFVRNILLTHVADHPEDKDGIDVSPEAKRASRLAMRRIHAEHVTMSRVRCCAHFLSFVCPCCCKFDTKGAMLPSEGDMIAAATLDISNDVAKKHVPTKDNTLYLTSAQALAWELHEHTDPRTGKVRPFLFNPHDGRSVWKWVITDQEED